MFSMATIIDLPDEIIELILNNKNISIEDIVSLQTTCNKLKQITFSVKFWRKKFYQRFPFSKKYYENDTNKLKNILSHVGTSVQCIKWLEYYVSMMPYNDLSNIQHECINFLRYISKYSNICCFILDDIKRIISTSCHDSNLTIKYNYGLIFHWIRQYRLIHQENEFINLPKEKLLLERQITIVVQYFLPHVSYSDIDTWLNDIVQEILRRLKNKHPTHSILSTSFEKFLFWRNNNIDDNFWNPTEVKKIICILKEYIFSELEFEKLFELFLTLDVDSNYDINYIVEHYRQYILSITYHSVARRLGIRCLLTTGGRNFDVEVTWHSEYKMENQWVKCFYIRRESRLQYPENIDQETCYMLSEFLQDPLYDISIIFYKLWSESYCDVKNNCNISYSWKFIKMAKRNFVREITCNFNNDHVEVINSKYARIANSIKDRTKIATKERPQIRNKIIKFAIGIIVRIQGYLAKRLAFLVNKINSPIGVIIGWHYKCKTKYLKQKFISFAPHLSECCVVDINCQNDHFVLCRCQKSYYSIHTEGIQHRPHYIILGEDNVLYYLPQDALSRCSPRRINNIEIGRYFSKFEGTHYVPNESLAKQYPTDIDAICEILPGVSQQCA